MTEPFIPRYSPELFQETIEYYEFTFAKTMPEIPHEWLARRQVRSHVWNWLVDAIYTHGVEESFYGKKFKYLYVGGYKYWCMGNPIPRTKIINRAKV